MEASPTFLEIAKLTALRAKLTVLRTGKLIPLWVDNAASSDDDGVFAFARASAVGETFAVIVLNASDADRVTSDGVHEIHLPASLKTSGKFLRPLLTSGDSDRPPAPEIDAAGPLRLPAPASSLVIYGISNTP